MKAIVGRNNVLQWAGRTLHDVLLDGVDQEHNDTQVAKKCRVEFEGFKCCRVRGHDGFHFSRSWDTDRMVITAAWEA